jgi:hypothetical protein
MISNNDRGRDARPLTPADPCCLSTGLGPLEKLPTLFVVVDTEEEFDGARRSRASTGVRAITALTGCTA